MNGTPQAKYSAESTGGLEKSLRNGPNAALCIDPFHVVSWATDALDEVRRRAWSEANRAAKEVQKRHVGRPKKGETESPEKKLAEDIRATRYA